MCVSVRHLPVQVCASGGVLYLALWFSFPFAAKAAVQNEPRSRPKVYLGPTGEASMHRHMDIFRQQPWYGKMDIWHYCGGWKSSRHRVAWYACQKGVDTQTFS